MQRIQFDRDFDAEIEEEQGSLKANLIAASRPGPTPVEIAILREEAFAAGRAEGVAAATAETEARLQSGFAAAQAETLAALLPQIAALREARAAHHHKLEQDLLALVHALAEQVLPEVFEAFAPSRLEAFCRKALRMAEGKGGLELRLPASQYHDLSLTLATAMTGSGAPLRLIADRDLVPGQAIARWDQGQAQHAQDAQHTAILATLAQLTNAPLIRKAQSDD